MQPSWGFRVSGGSELPGPREACPRLRGLTSAGVQSHTPQAQKVGGERSLPSCAWSRERALRRDSYGTLSPGAGAASRSRPRGSSVLPALSTQEACLQSPLLPAQTCLTKGLGLTSECPAQEPVPPGARLGLKTCVTHYTLRLVGEAALSTAGDLCPGLVPAALTPKSLPA